MHDNDSLTTDRANSTTAQLLADVASALAELDHLPALTVVSVSSNPAVAVTAGVAGWDDEEIRAIALWARAFASPVMIDLSLSTVPYAEIRTTVTVGGRMWTIARSGHHDNLSELRDRLGLDSAGGAQIEVSPHTLLATLDPDLTPLEPQAEDRRVYAQLAGTAAYVEPAATASADGSVSGAGS